jgi:hypothetical protein
MALLPRFLCSLRNVPRFNVPRISSTNYLRPLTGRSLDFRNVYTVDHIDLRTNLVDSRVVSIRSFHFSPIQYVEKNEEKKVEEKPTNESPEATTKLTLFQRFKQMYKDYWYVLIPVHVVTSVGWFGTFYFAVKRYAHLEFVDYT